MPIGRDYRQRRKVEERNAYLLRNFGISNQDYDELLGRQGGGCAICGRPPRKISLHVDHDHDQRAAPCAVCSAWVATTRSANSGTSARLTLARTSELLSRAIS